MPDQPRPTEHAEQQPVPKNCPGCGHDFHPAGNCLGIEAGHCSCHRNMAVHLDIARPQHAPSGEREAARDSALHPLVDEALKQYEAENARLRVERDDLQRRLDGQARDCSEMIRVAQNLRAELAQRTAELERLRDEIVWMRQRAERAEAQLAQLDQANVTLSGQNTELAQVWQQRDQYLVELQQMRRRTHEIQEAADKRYSVLVKELRDWERWKEILGRADKLIAEPGIACHSAVTRTVFGHLLLELQQARAVVSAAQTYAAIIRQTHGVKVPWQAWDDFNAALDHLPAVGEQEEPGRAGAKLPVSRNAET